MVTRAEAEKEALELAGFQKRDIVLMTKFSPVPYADEIVKNTPIIFDKHKRFWRYNKETGLYSDDAEQYVRTIIRKHLMGDEQQKRNYIEEIISYLKDIQYNENFEPDANPYLIPLKNKIFDLTTGKFLDFSPEYFITNKINIEIDENITTCPKIDKFFQDCVGEELKSILYDLPAYCLIREIPYQKIFFVFGPAGTGKSRYMEFVEYFLGKDNYCSVEPQKIQKDMHSTSQMWLKLANIVSDINYDALDNINLLKKLSGGDTITIRKMYREGFDEKLFLKQIFSTNKLPAVAEKTKAWYRRVYPIYFPNIIKQDERNPYIIKDITSPEEMKGFMWVILQRLKKMYENKFVFEVDIDEDEVAKVYEEFSNPVLMFIDENAINERDGWVFKYEFEERLNNWLRANHFPTYTKGQINQYMRDFYNESQRESFNGGKPYRVWVGLRWKKSDEILLSNQSNHFTEVLKRIYIVGKSFMNPCKYVKSVKSGEVPREIEVGRDNGL
jgi:P4 family phage/plasmid primase-like protien